jgi:amino acid adenylation domain-containing protein
MATRDQIVTVLQEQLSYWKDRLQGAAVLELPGDHPRPARLSGRGASRNLQLSPQLSEALARLSREQDVSLFVLLLAAWQVLLSRYSGQDDVVVGVPIANRSRQEVEPLNGSCANTLALRADLSGNPPFATLLQQTRQRALEAFAHQVVPFAQVVEALGLPRDLSREPLVQVMFAWQNAPLEPLSLGDVALEPLEPESTTSKFDLSLRMQEVEGRLVGQFEYSTDLFEAGTIERLIHHFEVLLESILDHPERPIAQLELLDAQDRHTQVVEWLDNEVDYGGPACLHALVEAWVDRTPEATAVLFEGRRLSYRELDEQANRLAHRLRQWGVGPETPVGIWTDRSDQHMILLYAVLKAGGAYVPIGPDDPPDRARFILDDTAAPVVLCDAAHRDRLEGVAAQVLVYDEEQPAMAALPSARPEPLSGPDNLAYIIYTSGSTGRPKGVMIEHRQIVDRTNWARAELGSTGADVFLHLYSLAFDGSLMPTWWPLSQGSTVLMPSSSSLGDPFALRGLILRHRVTQLSATPTLLGMLVGVLEQDPELPLRCVMPGGEQLSADLLHRLQLISPRVVNLYGPTEATILATAWEASPGGTERPLLGNGVANTRLYVLDEARQLLPVGAHGELYIGGKCVARGYRNRPELNEKHFLPDPFLPGGRMYRTGDLVRRRPDGNLEFLGRADHQVKVRGFRIELGEIETALAQHPAVHQVVVIVREDQPGDKRIVAYVVPTRGQTPTAHQLRSMLQAKLPGYMIPQAFVCLDALPLTANGKVDRRALREPDASSQMPTDVVTPRTSTEAVLARIWTDVLQQRPIGIHDNFFALGGHSLLAMQVVARVGHELQVDLPICQCFASPTIAEQARWIERAAEVEGRHTENTTFTTCHRIERTYDADIPIGRPIANTEVLILDADAALVPIGVGGEIYVAGDGLARGYTPMKTRK